METKPDCYQCKWRGDLSGDCHSRCWHPERARLIVRGHEHGVKCGWFFWPWNFDPVWLKACNGFEQKEPAHD